MSETQLEAIPNTSKSWADMEEEIGNIEWDWKGYYAKGFFQITAAYSGDGKSGQVLHTCGNSYILGKPWPDGSKFTGKTGNIGWFEAESAEAININRAKQWKLPRNRIIPPFDDPFMGLNMRLPNHIECVRKLMERDDIVVGIVDSLLGAAKSKNENDSAFFETCQTFAEIAKDTKKMIMGIHHIGKDPFNRLVREVTLEDVRGHSSIVQLSRVVIVIDKPRDPETKRLRVVKSNIGAFPPPIGFTIDKDGFINYCEAPTPQPKISQEETAAKIINHYLTKGKKAATEMLAILKKGGVSESTTKRVKKAMNVRVFQENIGECKSWWWELPTEATTSNGEGGHI